MIKDYFKFSIKSIRSRKVRSWLTMIGIFIGIAAVVSLISLGQGLQEAINDQFEQIGTNKIMVEAGGATLQGPPGSISSSKLTEDDLKVIKRVRGVDLAAPLIFKSAKIKSGDEAGFTFINGIPTDETKKVVEEMQSINIREGRKLKSTDNNKVVIGDLVNKGELFKDKIQLRDKIEIEGKEFRVVGILEPTGSPPDDKSMFIPIETAKDIFDTEDLNLIIIQIKKGLDPTTIAENIKKALRKSRNVKEGEEDFKVRTFEQLLNSFQTIFTVVQLVLVGIAAISLLVGGIGIMNTMYTSVLERTRDIGVMKAIGAKNKDILILFLIESGVLGIAGGTIGVILGIMISKTVEFIAFQALGTDLLRAVFPPSLIIGALLFSFIVGGISGVFPALQAAKLKPVDALRYE